MHRVDVGVLEKLTIIRIARLDTEAVANLGQLGLVSAADGVHLRAGMVLINRNELGAETEADDGHADFLGSCHGKSPYEQLIKNMSQRRLGLSGGRQPPE